MRAMHALRIWISSKAHDQNILSPVLAQEPRLAAPRPPVAEDDRFMPEMTLADRITFKMRAMHALRIWMSEKIRDGNILSPLLAQEPHLMGPARPEISNDQFLLGTPLAERITSKEALDEHITHTVTPNGHVTLAMKPKHEEMDDRANDDEAMEMGDLLLTNALDEFAETSASTEQRLSVGPRLVIRC